MAAKQETAAAELKPVEGFKALYDTTDVIFAGVMAKKGWRTGQQVTDKDYVEAVAAFLKAPLGRR